MSTRQRKAQRALATVDGPWKAKIYRGKFRAFESIKYLDVAALKRAKKVPIEIGTIEAQGVKATLVAEVRQGMITKIKPLDSPNCIKPKPETKAGKAAFMKAAREALKRVQILGEPVTKLPIPIESVRTIRIGPVVIIYNDHFNICIVLDFPDDDMVCMICLFGRPICAGPIGPP
jgi:hypothetical protein